MTTLTYSIEINASPEKIWQTLWDQENYKVWTNVFSQGSYYKISDFKEGNTIHFLTPRGDGMYSLINKLEYPDYISFQHLGEIVNFEELPNHDPEWGELYEIYELHPEGQKTTLIVKVDTLTEYAESMNKTFPLALQKAKEVAEQP